MLFRRLSFHNFGLLAGNQTVELQTDAAGPGGAPIVLIGGQNGAGKTTILEALRLCLYGRAAFDGPISQNEYHEYLLGRIHRPKGQVPAPDGACILLEFELTSQGRVDIYKVQRSWRRRSEDSSKVGENVLIFKNDALLDDVEADYWQEFIQGLIPSGLSQLFFFDGEQIQKLADEETDTRALGDAVKALLGLEVVERLRNDLAIYVGKEAKKVAAQSPAGHVEKATADFQVIERELDVLRTGKAALAEEIDRTRKEIERVERELMTAGRGLYDDREKHQRKRTELEATTKQIERRLEDLCEAEFPFTLCADLCRDLQQQLQKERDLVRWQASRDHVKAFAHQVISRARKVGESGPGLEKLIQASLADAERPPEELKAVQVMHGLSSSAHAAIEGWLESALNRVPSEVKGLNRDLERVQRALAKTQQALGQVPDQDTLKPLMERLFKLQQELADLTVKDANFDQAITERANLGAMAERALGRAAGQLKELEGQEKRLHYAARTQEALKAFQERLTNAKLRRLEEVFVETFNYLSRKLSVSRANIHAGDFRVELFDEDGKALPKSQFSAGEKQIYAIAMLWSLAKISGRNLPVVIDTPLGRLDSIHRKHLLERYFPEASHQVIILSTDTEIDHRYFDELRPHVARSYYLRHERGDRVTRLEEGYFWKELARA